MTRPLLVLLILIYFLLGLLLVLLPWSHIWESSYFLRRFPALTPYLMSPFLRGAITGLGFLDMTLAAGMIRRSSVPTVATRN